MWRAIVGMMVQQFNRGVGGQGIGFAAESASGQFYGKLERVVV